MDINGISGLSTAEAGLRLARDGYNELPSASRRSSLELALEVVREPMLLLLVACGAIYLALGDRQEALMLLAFVFLVMGITLYQERKTERALEALRDLSSPRALVIRYGQQMRIPGREVVRGDVLLLAEGDRVPADAALISCLNLSVDESLLTGESVPARKAACEDGGEMGRPGGDGLPFIFSGSLVVQGQGVARVVAVGEQTEMGRIGQALKALEPEDTPLKKETRRMVRNLTALGLLLCAVVVAVYGLTREDWLNGFLAGITLAMAILPEEFPVVLTIFLALGAWRISRNRVLTRRVPAVEALGAATVLCTDKTGTITFNRMEVHRIYAGGRFFDLKPSGESTLPEEVHEAVEFGILAGQRDPFNPMEKALKKVGQSTLNNTEHLHDDWELVKEYPLSEELLAMSRVWRSRRREEYVIASKGSPEAIFDLCHLDAGQIRDLSARVEEMAGDGLRVLGVARSSLLAAALPGEQHEFGFEFLGLLGFQDPVRPTVAPSVKECYDAGIRVVMITGDHPATAANIAAQIGLHREAVVTGPELDGMDDRELQMKVREANVFARVVPEQKLRLVNAFKANGEIVAMTGDGVNDAPALKAAHIGIAMGGRGTDVARESASMVLLDDDFSSIVQAVRMGRRIFDNIRKAMAYIFAIHVPIAGMSLMPVLLGWPLVLLPVHIAFLELIIDPACSVVFEAEAEEAGVMKRPPRDPSRPMFNRRAIGLAVLQGLSVLLIVATVFYIDMFIVGHGQMEARALAFTTLVVANLGLILTNRSWSRTIPQTLRTPNPALWWIVGGTLALLGLVLYSPFLRDLFHFQRLHGPDLAICLGAGALSILWFEGLKMVNGRGG
ncbi:MAG: cation-translocating P-type ATPase [Methanosarcinales archaeon]|nr:cation-translocating P-type ATPase [Methanosarcinales archaeon]